jgi:ribosomal-protein-alanine N-acetyltransferase
VAVQLISQPRASESAGDWRAHLPVLRGERVVLRELRAADAPALLAVITPPDVSRFISPPPPNVPAFERFIARSRAQQVAGKLACFAVTLKGDDTAIGIFQVRELEPNFKSAEWGFAIGSAFWGTGLFEECANLVLEFGFTSLGVHRMEARAAARNGRGNRALQKIGAIQEGVLRQAFLCDGENVDQIFYGFTEEEWRASRHMARRHAPPVVFH